MWFFDEENPNNSVSVNRGLAAPSTCEIEYFHKSEPTPEADTFTECHPWASAACCDESTVENQDIIKTLYGEEYHWDLCGPVSPECTRFYVQEVCLYECDANVGHYRRYKDMTKPLQAASYDAKCDPDSSLYDEGYAAANKCLHTQYDARCDEYSESYDSEYAQDKNCAHNAWEIHGMPVKASYCKAWYNACRFQPVCRGGNVLECGKSIVNDENEMQPTIISNNLGLEIGVGVAAGLSALTVIILAILVVRERIGKPVFMRVPDDEVELIGVAETKAFEDLEMVKQD